ncbi:MAG: tripartite tricarboxylate transporter permease [Methylobacteriaceae bacterium]|jgi:putative tricarboxylic transport membrane protein|nr:tripartite tricarboxylate transporter permease [Methylobacteriaceae bacterium]
MVESLQMLAMGFSVATSVENLLAAFIGAILGILVGAMPGIGSLAGCALLLPITFKFNPVTAIIMLGAIYYSNMFGGAYSAILLNVPGDSPAIMTALDGYPLARKGRAGKALLTSNVSSFVGGVIGMVILVFLGPALARLGLKFGPSEMAALMLVAMTSVSWLVGENPVKGVIATCLGMMIATMGVDGITGNVRYDFGNIYLLGGINFIPLVIGFIGLAQVFELAENRFSVAEPIQEKFSILGGLLTRHDIRRITPPVLKSSFLGTFVGFLPGAGATTASFLGYAIQKKFGKNEEELGTGAIEGLAAAEAANNAAAAGAFGPLLSLGIPGSGTTAVLLGGLMMWGLNPGPMLFASEPEFAWGLIASLFISNLIALLVAMISIPWMAKVIRVPVGVMIPSIITICFVGAYATTNSMYGVVIMVIGGVLGYLFQKNDYPVAPLLLAYVLSSSLEINVRRALVISKGSVSIFFERPISLVLMLVFFTLILAPVIRGILSRARKQRP